MDTIHLEPNQVPAQLRGSYSGRKFKAVVTEQVSIPSDAGLWSGGSRDLYSAVNLATGESMLAKGQQAAPWNRPRGDHAVELVPGFAVVLHSMFCGKDMGLTFYVHPADAVALLPAPAAELTALQRIVLNATASFKASYGGKDRYQMARDEATWRHSNGQPVTFPPRDQWDAAKAELIAAGYLNAAGAITVKGRNARV